jgi:hypothetical protein
MGPWGYADTHDDVDPGVRGALEQRRDVGDAQGIGVRPSASSPEVTSPEAADDPCIVTGAVVRNAA